MRYTEIANLFEAAGSQGPYVSLYLTARGDKESAVGEMALRWKNTRHAMAGDGAPEAALAAIDPVVTDPVTGEGRTGNPAPLAVIATREGVRWSGRLPGPLSREVVAQVGPLPDVVPLLAAAQVQVPHLVVLTDRTGAEIVARLPDGGGHWEERVEHVEGADSPVVHRSKPGGWSQRRYQQRAEVQWDQNAGLVAETLTKLADRTRPRFVAVAGDVRALQFLRENASKRLRNLLHVVGGEYRSIEQVIEQADKVATDTAAEDSAALLAKLAEERGQRDRAVVGAAPTLAALARGQVDTLLVGSAPDDERIGWFGPNPSDVATDREALIDAGVAEPQRARLVDVALRAAMGTGASIRVISQDDAADLPDGIGGLLRFSP